MPGFSEEDVSLFRQIPCKTHKVKLIVSFPNSFTGKECYSYMKKNFSSLSDEEIIKWASTLMQAGVFKPLNFRLTTSFQNQAKYLYELCVSLISCTTLNYPQIINLIQ